MPVRWRIDLEYEGSGFVGWQLQPDGRSVQGVVEAALEQLLGHPARLYSAGRTDTGVHAEQQVAVFDTHVTRTPRGIVGGLNGLLPEDVSCLIAVEVDAGFDPRRAPHTKRYRYRWLDRRVRSPLRRGRTWHHRQPLDAEAMDRAARQLEGQHDFSAFRAVGCAAAHAVRTIEGCRVVRQGDEVHLVVDGTGFLRHMIRIVAGSLTEVGLGRRPPEWLREVLESRRRQLAGPTAPAHGLTLERITYLDAWPRNISPREEDPAG